MKIILNVEDEDLLRISNVSSTLLSLIVRRPVRILSDADTEFHVSHITYLDQTLSEASFHVYDNNGESHDIPISIIESIEVL